MHEDRTLTIFLAELEQMNRNRSIKIYFDVMNHIWMDRECEPCYREVSCNGVQIENTVSQFS